jgi:hypothetical protein
MANYHNEALRLTDEYTSRLLAILNRWRRRVHPPLHPVDIRQLANDLAEELQDEAEVTFALAYLLGAGYLTTMADPLFLTSIGQQTVNRYLSLNLNFLTHRLVPYAVHLLSRSPLDLTPLSHRISLYSQPVWSLVGEGTGERARSYDLSGTPYTVTWHLDDLVAHCATCPPKARTYPSWSDMLFHCGGPPGSLEADDDCGPGCRCWLELTPASPILQTASSMFSTSPLRYAR